MILYIADLGIVINIDLEKIIQEEKEISKVFEDINENLAQKQQKENPYPLKKE